MAGSPARTAANQRNALKSSGPKTPEGKAASKLNAFKHGLAGEGTLLAPDEDAELVARRTIAFIDEFGAVGETGIMLARRAALLSVRMERSSDREQAAVAANMAEARLQFDADRLDEVDGWVAKLDDPDACLTALEVLETSPEGLNHLLTFWGTLRDEVRSGDDHASDRAIKRAVLRLDLGDADFEALKAGKTETIDAEVDRLRVKAESVAPLERAIAARREQTAKLARFDPSPEATLARRYEAAAERGMYRAIRAITEVRRGREINLATVLRDASPRPSPTPAPLGCSENRVRHVNDDASSHSAIFIGSGDDLGHHGSSFRAEVPAAPSPPLESLPSLVAPSISDIERRRNRPDLRKLLQNRR